MSLLASQIGLAERVRPKTTAFVLPWTAHVAEQVERDEALRLGQEAPELIPDTVSRARRRTWRDWAVSLIP